MPTISIFIRKDDVPKWHALQNKSEWLHEQLKEADEKRERQASRQTSMDAPHLRPKPHPRPLDDIMERLDTQVQRTTTIPTPFVPRPPDPETGYPCCELAKPCKHWSFDGTRGLWVNELTGKTKEVA